MTWTVGPDDPKRAFYRAKGQRRSARESRGRSYYPPEFWRDGDKPMNHTLRLILHSEWWLSLALPIGVVLFIGIMYRILIGPIPGVGR